MTPPVVTDSTAAVVEPMLDFQQRLADRLVGQGRVPATIWAGVRAAILPPVPADPDPPGIVPWRRPGGSWTGPPAPEIMIPLRQAGIQLRLHWRSERRNPRPLYWLWSGTHPLRKWILDQLAAELSLPLLMLYAPTGELACGPHDAIPHLLRHGGIIAWGGEADQSWLDTLQGVIDASTDHQHATVLIVALPGPRVGRRLSPDRMLQLTWPAPSASDLAEWLLTGLPRGTGGDPREVWDVPLNRAIAVRAAATWLAWDHLAEQVAGVVSPEPHEWLRWIWMSLAPLDPDQVWEQWQVALPPDLDRETRERFHELVSLWVEPLRGSMPELEDFDGS